jgi:hypothetical protein
MNDTFGPVTIWYGGFVAGMLSTVWFVLLHRRSRSDSTSQ